MAPVATTDATSASSTKLLQSAPRVNGYSNKQQSPQTTRSERASRGHRLGSEPRSIDATPRIVPPDATDDSNGAKRAIQPRARPGLLRAKSDFGPRGADKDNATGQDDGLSEGDWSIRHGFESQLLSEEYNNILTSNFLLYFTGAVHESGGSLKEDAAQLQVQEWRMKDRLKTVSAVLLLCLNIGVDPPDVIKTIPCAKLECWIDPQGSTPGSSTTQMNQIGKALSSQYEALSMRTRYKVGLDPTVEETRKYCTNLRRSARSERVMFHYNGHGVPRPTPSGEIWAFNKGYTQYIPISLYDLQTWILAPSIMVYDCASAGLIVQNWLKFAEKHQAENDDARQRDPNAEAIDFSDCIHLAACRADEMLPTNPDLPADLFTACLTTPIETAIRFYILQNPLPSTVSLADAANIPGRVSERRTPIGELNWIFTAITDTIAWNSLPKPLFKKLFRQDLMVAALFRNFLLAQRVMRVYHCHPICHPSIPETHDHPLWKSWDLAVELILAQLPSLLAAEHGNLHYEYQHSNFFRDQLTAFEVYLSTDANERKPPEQLPIVLQVLLSQVHRLRALVLLSKFLDMGPWAVNLALSIGIFPYVLKLLQSQATELKPVMVFIWTRILAVDRSCQSDLIKDNGFQYFTNLLSPNSGTLPVHNENEHRAMCCFIIAMFCKDFEQGRTLANCSELMDSLLSHFDTAEPAPLLRQYSCLCLGALWQDHPEAKWMGVRHDAIQRLCELKSDPCQEVRAAMLWALTTFLGIREITPQVAWIEESILATVLHMANDGNVIVRRELVVLISTFIARYIQRFRVAAFEQLVNQVSASAANGAEDLSCQQLSYKTTYGAIWRQTLVLSVDPAPQVAGDASMVVDYVLSSLLEPPLADETLALMEELGQNQTRLAISRPPRVATRTIPIVEEKPPTVPEPVKQDGYFTSSLRRTASVAASIRNLALGHSSTESTPTRSTKPRVVSENVPMMAKSYHGPAKIPMPKNYHPQGMDQPPRIPLRSRFFEWSMEYFRSPQMKSAEADEPGSEEYNKRLWRRNRNDKIMAETQPQKESAGTNRWDKAKGFFDNGTQPLKMIFHQFEDHLIVSDDKDSVCVWNWNRQIRMSRFSNQNPPSSNITDLRLINEDDQALLMTGSSDGVIRIFRNYDDQQNVELASGFSALTDLVPSNKNAGLVFDWQQSRGDILVAGDVKVIKVWRAGQEKVDQSLPARSGSCVTSLTSDQVEGNVFIGGFGDGAVRVYDRRQHPRTSLVKVWKEHKQWVTNVHLQRGGRRELITASRGGDVKLWDIRLDQSVQTIRATRDGLRSLSVHEHAPVFATGSERHNVKIFNINGTFLSSFEPYSSFLHQNRSAPISATAFHPHRMMIAGAAYQDAHVNIYACNDAKKQDVTG